MSVRRIVAAGAACLLGASCSLESLDGLASGDAADSGSEAAPGDTGPSSDAEVNPADAGLADVVEASSPSDGSAGCVNLILNGGFEEQKACAPWTNFGGSAGDGAPARSGANACLACTAGAAAGPINLVTGLIGRTFGPGEVVHFEAWLRASDGALFAAGAWLYVSTDTTGAAAPTAVLLSNAYQRIAVDYVIPVDGGPAQTPVFQFLVNGLTDAGGECFLIDDIVACRQIDGG